MIESWESVDDVSVPDCYEFKLRVHGPTTAIALREFIQRYERGLPKQEPPPEWRRYRLREGWEHSKRFWMAEQMTFVRGENSSEERLMLSEVVAKSLFSEHDTDGCEVIHLNGKRTWQARVDSDTVMDVRKDGGSFGMERDRFDALFKPVPPTAVCAVEGGEVELPAPDGADWDAIGDMAHPDNRPCGMDLPSRLLAEALIELRDKISNDG